MTFIENRAINPSPDSVKEAWVVKVPIQKKIYVDSYRKEKNNATKREKIKRSKVLDYDFSFAIG